MHLQLVKVSPLRSDLVVRSQLADESVHTPRAEQLHNEREVENAAYEIAHLN